MNQLEIDVCAILSENPHLITKISEPTQHMLEIVVTKRPSTIQYIANPSPELYLLAFKENPLVLGLLPEEYHTDARCKTAINVNPLIFNDLKNTSKTISEYAVSKHSDNIKHIPNPSEDIQKLAVAKNPETIKYLKNPSDDVCMLAIRKNMLVFPLIRNPSKNVILLAIELCPDNLIMLNIINTTSVKNYEFWKTIATHKPSMIFLSENKIKCKNKDEIITIALKGDQKWIDRITNPTEEQQLIAVNSSGWFIKHISNPTHAVYVAAVTNNPMALNAINKQNQTNEICIAAVAGDPKAVKYIRLPRENWNNELIYEVAVNIV